MLQREVDRGSWYIVSTDGASVVESLRELRHTTNITPLGAGIQFWEDWTRRIQKATVERVEESKDSFSDLMLKEWCREMLCVGEEGNNDEQLNMFDTITETVEQTVGPGSLVQASQDPTTYMLFDQLFHKSTILIYKETEDFSLGLILNLPTSDAYEHTLPDGTNVRIPIRYGGPVGHGDDDDDKQTLPGGPGATHMIWVHNNKHLRDAKVGKSISAKQSSLWTCSQIEALNAIDLGLAKPSDFLVIRGYALWEKEMGLGGVAGEIVSGTLQEVDMDRTDAILAIFGSQPALHCLGDVESTFSTTKEAWEMCRTVDEEYHHRCVYGTDVTLPEFADEALQRWIEIFLLDKRTYVPV